MAGKSSARAREMRTFSTLVLPVVTIVAVAFLIPVLLIMIRSVTDPQLGLQNYVWLLTNDYNIELIIRTLKLAGGATAITALLGYPYAYLLANSGPRLRGILIVIVLLPFWTSMMVRTFAWIIILQNNGVLNTVLSAFGLPTISILGTSTAVLIGMCQILMPFMVLPMASVMQSIDPRVPKAAQVMGATPSKSFLTVYLPLSLPGVLAGSLIVFILSLGFYITPALLGSPNEQILPNALFTQIAGLLNWGQGGALAVALLVTVGLVFALVLWITKLLGLRLTGIGGSQI